MLGLVGYIVAGYSSLKVVDPYTYIEDVIFLMFSPL